MDTTADEHAAFSASRERFEQMLSFLDGQQAGALGHGELEEQVAERGRELMRQLYQDHLDLRSERETRLERVLDDAGVPRRSVETGHQRGLATVFGEVTVRRLAYRRRGQATLHPADAALNLPEERHSHGLRRQAAQQAARGSFDEATATIRTATGVELGKRQIEHLAARPPPRWTSSTPAGRTSPLTQATSSSCPPTARASSCAPARYARPPQRWHG